MKSFDLPKLVAFYVFGGSKPSKTARDRQHRQDVSEVAQDRPKTAPNKPKIFQDGPRYALGAPRQWQDGS